MDAIEERPRNGVVRSRSNYACRRPRCRAVVTTAAATCLKMVEKEGGGEDGLGHEHAEEQR